MRRYIPDFVNTIPKEAKSVFKGVIYETFQWQQEMFDGSRATFEMLRRPDTVQVVAVKDGKLVLTHQRQPREDWFYGFPGGRHDEPEEDELQAAKRELLEETGMQFKTWKLIEVRQPFGRMDWLDYTFLATDFISQGPQHLDAGEEIEVVEVPFEDIAKLINPNDPYRLKISYRTEFKNLDELLAAPSLYEY